MTAGRDPVGNPRSGRRDHRRLEWDEALEGLVARLLPTWLGEDLGHECDWTSIALVPDGARAELDVVARAKGVVAGLRGAGIVAAGVDPRLEWRPAAVDGASGRRDLCGSERPQRPLPGAFEDYAACR